MKQLIVNRLDFWDFGLVLIFINYENIACSLLAHLFPRFNSKFRSSVLIIEIVRLVDMLGVQMILIDSINKFDSTIAIS